MAKRKKIAILFATGTVLSSLKNRSIVFVDTESDIAKWMESIPEISLIADIEPHFFLSESKTMTLAHTAELSAKIHDVRNRVDGIVVLMRTEAIIQQATLLNFLNQHWKIPVIFTGSVVSPQALAEGVSQEFSKKNSALSLKSNVINAVQVATRDFRGFGIMYGNRLIEPVHARRDDIESLNVFSAVDGVYAGRVEFGISLNQKKDHDLSIRHYDRFTPDITVVDSLLLNVDHLRQCRSRAIIICLRENEQLPLDVSQQLRDLKVPVILYNYWYVLEHQGLITVSGMTPESLFAKVMVIAEDSKSLADFRKKMTENYIGETLR